MKAGKRGPFRVPLCLHWEGYLVLHVAPMLCHIAPRQACSDRLVSFLEALLTLSVLWHAWGSHARRAPRGRCCSDRVLRPLRVPGAAGARARRVGSRYKLMLGLYALSPDCPKAHSCVCFLAVRSDCSSYRISQVNTVHLGEGTLV